MRSVRAILRDIRTDTTQAVIDQTEVLKRGLGEICQLLHQLIEVQVHGPKKEDWLHGQQKEEGGEHEQEATK